MYRAIRPLLFQLDPERSHDLVLGALARISRNRPLLKATRAVLAAQVPALPVEVMGIRFPNPVGLAAGLDKQGNCANAFSATGFGWVELGTVTPKPQPGNARPRMFRLADQSAIINRMGFNSIGLDAFLANVAATAPEVTKGINIGKNATTPLERAADDYLACMDAVFVHADYITINISSPNTKNLRALQEDDALDELLAQLRRRGDELSDRHGKRVPLVLKIAPDLDDNQASAIADLLRKHRIDGVAATNTTLSRGGVESAPDADQSGGLSGQPLGASATAVIRGLHRALAGEIPVIGIGGIHSAEDAREKFVAGASLVQLYTGLIYEGPALIRQIVNALAAESGGTGFSTLLERLHSESVAISDQADPLTR